MRSSSRIGGRDKLGAERRREASGCQQALMVNRCGGTPSLLLSLEQCTHTHTHALTHTYCNMQSGKGKAKQPFGVNSWDGRDGCGRLYAERSNWEKTISVIETGRVNPAVFGSFIFCRNPCLVRSQNESEEWSTQPDLSPSRAGQSAVFDSEADIKQLLSVPDMVGQWATF